jgi:hypothetical protein
LADAASVSNDASNSLVDIKNVQSEDALNKNISRIAAINHRLTLLIELQALIFYY